MYPVAMGNHSIAFLMVFILCSYLGHYLGLLIGSSDIDSSLCSVSELDVFKLVFARTVYK